MLFTLRKRNVYRKSINRACSAPFDYRSASRMIDPPESETTLMPAELVARFESLGDNCEFGLVQRRAGAEPLGLLRFSSMALPDLIAAIDADFAGLGDPAQLECLQIPAAVPEHAVRDTRHNLLFRTFQPVGSVDGATLMAQQATRLRFLRRKFLEDLEEGEKIFVVRRFAPAMDIVTELEPLSRALGRHGPSTLLGVALADETHQPGTVQRLGERLLLGRLDRLAPDNDAHDLSYDTWLEVCANAIRLAGQQR